jgi:hypothetical protein
VTNATVMTPSDEWSQQLRLRDFKVRVGATDKFVKVCSFLPYDEGESRPSNQSSVRPVDYQQL